jgi:hypothetical protein
MTGYTSHHGTYLAHRLTLEGRDDDAFAKSLSTARVETKPHQVDAALFALQSPLSKGVILADEVGLGKTIEASMVIAQRWAERRRRILLIVPASLRKQWQQELREKFSLPSTILDARTYRDAEKAGRRLPFDVKETVILVSYEFAARRSDEIKRIAWDLVIFDEAHNRLIHKRFRQEMIDASRKVNRKYSKPMGPEEIVYGDKVINLDNTDLSLPWYRHRKVYPAKDSPYIANGEIGMAEGFFWKKGLPDLRYKLEVEFSSQPRFKYDFTGRDFSEEGNPALELAYALTVHKSQGSEFGTVFLVLPNPCRLLSRELLYTALTRQKDRIVILHQGPRGELRKYSSDNQSETARRLTNLFALPAPIAIDGRIFEENLIHRTNREEMVRSKSEVIIANELAHRKVEYGYEQPLTIGSVTKYPDFTIEDAEAGRNFYWEHCGMLHVPSYRRRWEEKLAWYKANGILPHEEGGGPQGTLIVTRDEANGSIDSAKINQVLKTILNV